VSGPRNGIIQVVINLLFNAADSTASVNAPEITLAAKVEGRGVTLSVHDNGAGFAEDTMGRATEPFFSTKDHGTGLGLSISYGIIERCRGRIALANQPEGGAVVTIWLPAA
jgi:two-component system sensor histidine kinase HupT/HoxJ